jgi:putative ABC transport system permease protein
MLRASLRSLFQHKLRLVLTVLAIVAGVAFVAGTYIFTDSLKQAFDRLFLVNQPDVTVSARNQLDPTAGAGGRGASSLTLPDSLIGTVRAVHGVKAAYGVVRGEGAVVLDKSDNVVGQAGQPARGTSWVPDTALSSLTLVAGKAPVGPDQVVLLESTATAAGVGVGNTVHLETPRGRRDPVVVGLASRGIAATDGSTLVVFDLATAQQLLLEKPAQVSAIVVSAQPGVSQSALVADITKVLPKDTTARTGQQLSADLANSLESAFTFINTFLLVFALIALFVACFLIYNTFSMLVAQRTRELALLRAIGASRGQVRRSVVGEAVVIGLVSSALGLVGGIGISQLLRILFSQFGATLPAGPLVIEPRTVVVSTVVGLVVTVVSAYLPARRAALIPPIAAMREEVTLPTRSLRNRTILGVVLLTLAVLLARHALQITDDVNNAAMFAGLSALATLIATIAAAPVVGRGVLKVLGAPFAWTPVGRLAQENGRRNPRRTAATAGALAIGVALMTSVGVIAASAKASVNQVVNDTIGADFIVLGATFQPFSPAVFTALKGTPGASVVTYSRNAVVSVAGQQSLVTGVQPEQFRQVFAITMTAGAISDLALGGALVDSTTATRDHLMLGQTVTATFVNGPGTLRIDGIYSPSGVTQGFIVNIPTLTSVGSLERDSAVYVRLVPGASAAAVRSELDTRLKAFPSVQLTNQADIKDQIDAQFDRVFGFIYALLALAVVVAFLGIVNTLALSVHERRREVGLLRAVGTSRAQLRRMVILESVLIAVFGGVVGIVIGIVYGVLLQKVLASQGVKALAIPTGQVALFIGLSVLGGFLAALWPAVTAARMNVLRAIAAE